MYSNQKAQSLRRFYAILGLFFAISQFQALAAGAEEHFDTLTIGTQTYSNVTVTTRNKTYVFLLHSAGMINVKVADLSSEEKQMLGYEPKKPATNAAVAWAKQTIEKIESPQVKELQQQLSAGNAPPDLAKLLGPMLSIPVLIGFVAVMLGFYVFVCYCSMLICRKAGSEPGALIWFPILQMFPLLRAAGMSGWWFLVMLLPFVSIIAHLVWCIKITNARGKGAWTAIFLILPFTSFFAFLYLAFSDGAQPKENHRERMGMMTLETA